MSKHNKIKFINFNLFNNEKVFIIIIISFTQLAMVQCEKEDDHDDHDDHDHMAVIIDIKDNVA